MRMSKSVLIMLGAIAVCGCAPLMAVRYSDRRPPELRESLFADDQTVLRDETIERILNAKNTLPPKVRVAVMRFGGRGEWYSEELARLDQAVAGGVVGKLRACPRVADAMLLPSMLTPEKQSVPYLRQAAARFQAHLLVLYRTSTQTYEKERLLAPSKAKSYCYVEAVLLDVRTGLVPFASASMKTFVAEKQPDDANFWETSRRSELKAAGEGLAEISDDMVRFLASMSTDDETRDSVKPAAPETSRK